MTKLQLVTVLDALLYNDKSIMLLQSVIKQQLVIQDTAQ